MPVHPPAGLLPCIIHDGSLQISPKYILVKRNSLGNGADSYWSPPAHSFLTRPPIGRHFSPAQPSDCLAIDFPGRAISPGEDFLFPPLRDHTFSPKGVAKLSFTARIERAHSLRARSASRRTTRSPSLLLQLSYFSLQRAACLVFHCARPTRAFSGRALREHRRPTGCPLALLPNSVTYSPQGGLVDPQMRASNEHLPSVRVPRAGGRPGYPVSLLFEQPLHPCLNLIQPLAQVGLKHIGFGLHDHALGLDLILKQHQLGKQLLLL